MTTLSVQADLPDIVVADSLSPYVRNLVTLAKAYSTVLLLYEDDFSDSILAAWAETDRLNLSTRKIGVTPYGIDVHVFGLDPFPAGTRVEITIREASGAPERQNSQRAAYKSLLNELALMAVRVRLPGR